MSYDSQQQSQYGGELMTFFKFVSGSRSWLLCNQREEILWGADLYLPEVVTIDKLEQNLAETERGVEIMVPSSSAIALEFKPYLPPEPITVRVYSRHRTDPAEEYKPIFLGETASCAFDTDGMATILCMPVTHKLKRAIPWCVYSATCNWAVYSLGCGADRELFKVDGTVQSITGSVLTAAAFASKPDGWLRAGYVVRVTTNEVRWITAHTGSSVTLTSPFLGLQAGEPLVAYAGCDGLESTCSGKFNNLPRFWGFPDSPERNPFTDDVFGQGTTLSGSGGGSARTGGTMDFKS